uniref:Pentacotripeptide-repeat region of PRORP domain-containing protein n=1 Tax=Oryza punctata TaxID=4537 RepID=A0A0E0KAR7_ORYPU
MVASHDVVTSVLRWLTTKKKEAARGEAKKTKKLAAVAATGLLCVLLSKILHGKAANNRKPAALHSSESFSFKKVVSDAIGPSPCSTKHHPLDVVEVTVPASSFGSTSDDTTATPARSPSSFGAAPFLLILRLRAKLPQRAPRFPSTPGASELCHVDASLCPASSRAQASLNKLRRLRSGPTPTRSHAHASLQHPCRRASRHILLFTSGVGELPCLPPRATPLIEKMPEFGCVTNVAVYTALLNGMCSFGDVDAVLGLVEEMEGGILGAGCVTNVVSYTCLVKCLCGKRRMVEALGLLDRMTGRGVMPNRVFVRTLVGGFYSEEMVVDAYAVVEHVVSDGSVSSDQCYNVLLVCLWRVGMDGEAEGLVQRMMKKGVRLSPLAASVMVRELCNRNRLLDACYLIGVMEENGVLCDTDFYNGLLLRLCVEGHVGEALALAKKVAERGILLEASCADHLTDLLKQYGDEELA